MGRIQQSQPGQSSSVFCRRCHPKIVGLAKRGPGFDSDRSRFQAKRGAALFLSLTDAVADRYLPAARSGLVTLPAQNTLESCGLTEQKHFEVAKKKGRLPTGKAGADSRYLWATLSSTLRISQMRHRCKIQSARPNRPTHQNGVACQQTSYTVPSENGRLCKMLSRERPCLSRGRAELM